MFIQIYTGNFFPEPTGIGKYTGEMAEWLARAGHEVEVICGFPYYPHWKLMPPYRRTAFHREIWQGVRVLRVPHYIPKTDNVSSLQRMLIDLSICLASSWHGLRTLLSLRAPDVVIGVCPPLFSGIWPSLIGLLRRKPSILHVQDFQVDAAIRLGMLKPRWLGMLLLTLERALLRRATLVSSITPAMCRMVQSKGVAASRLFSLPNWSDLSGVHPRLRDEAMRLECGAKPEQILVMYAGAMGRKQGLELVTEAADALRDDPRFHFVMIGDGSEAQNLRRAAERRRLGNLVFLPLQPQARLGAMLASADLHLVIQKGDAEDLVMPSKLCNILAAGRPAIVTATPGTALWDAVHEERTGLAIEPDRADALVRALQLLADSPEQRAEMRARARHYAENHLDQDAILRRFEEQVRNLVYKDASSMSVALDDKPHSDHKT